MNELHDDDPDLRLFKLNRINALLDKSLDYAWELSHGGNREKHEIIIDKDMCLNRYSDIINDKLDLVTGIGELLDSYMADAYNIVDGINKNHNNSLLYDILAEDLKKCKDTILKMINCSNVCAKQDTNNDKTDTTTTTTTTNNNNNNNNNDKPDTKVKDNLDAKKKDSKPDTKVKGKPDTKKKDAKKKGSKPDTKVKDKPDTKVEDKPDTKVKDKPDTKVKDKPDSKVKDNPDTKVKDNPDTKVKDNSDTK